MRPDPAAYPGYRFPARITQTQDGGGPTQRGFRGYYRSDDGGATF